CKKSLEKIGKSQGSPTLVSKLSLDAIPSYQAGWKDEVGLKIKESLILPEEGDVTLELKLKGDGTYIAIRIIKFNSPKNKKYIEEMVPRLKFPSNPNQKEGSFVITLSHEV